MTKTMIKKSLRAYISRNKKEHFGLGLSIAADLARLQDIRLRLTDTAGGGCTFTLEIPH
ncbi:ATP-binding protein [Mediterraneibacter glycyrrhizinilyticus]|nr:ATP-binding protein [Mediterraneibacter glycyrrhizinilyticus]MBM6852741.1 ATP-binding protein [Mediterraneibacter glycyrrhizinilyticus]